MLTRQINEELILSLAIIPPTTAEQLSGLQEHTSPVKAGGGFTGPGVGDGGEGVGEMFLFLIHSIHIHLKCVSLMGISILLFILDLLWHLNSIRFDTVGESNLIYI